MASNAPSAAQGDMNVARFSVPATVRMHDAPSFGEVAEEDMESMLPGPLRSLLQAKGAASVLSLSAAQKYGYHLLSFIVAPFHSDRPM